MNEFIGLRDRGLGSLHQVHKYIINVSAELHSFWDSVARRILSHLVSLFEMVCKV